MEKVIHLFENDDISLFFDKQYNKLLLLNDNIYYNIDLRSKNEEDLNKKIDRLSSSFKEI